MSTQRLAPESVQEGFRQVVDHGCSVAWFRLEHVL